MNYLKENAYLQYSNTVEYKEGDLVIKDGVLSQYWKYPNTGDLVWLNVNNYEQYDLFLNI